MANQTSSSFSINNFKHFFLDIVIEVEDIRIRKTGSAKKSVLANPDKYFHRSLSMKMTKNLGMVLLGIWLIATGLIPLLNLSFPWLGTLMAIVAIAAGALILAGK